MIATGVARPSAHGQLITSVVRALTSQTLQLAGLLIMILTTGGRTASINAPIHTAGV